MSVTAVPERHIVSAYDQELDTLKRTLVEMAGIVETQVWNCSRAVVDRNPELAQKAISDDKSVDARDRDVNDQTIRILALRQPMANDLRLIIAASKVSHSLERIGDYAKNCAKRSLLLNQSDPLTNVAVVNQLSKEVLRVLRLAIDAFVEMDAEKARQAWLIDEQVDALHSALFESTLAAMEAGTDPARPSAHLLFVSKNFERMGDWATNIAEIVYFMITGDTLDGARPKADSSSDG
jgi:phosphate transport system protein